MCFINVEPKVLFYKAFEDITFTLSILKPKRKLICFDNVLHHFDSKSHPTKDKVLDMWFGEDELRVLFNKSYEHITINGMGIIISFN